MSFTDYQDENCFSRYPSQPRLRPPRPPLTEIGTNVLGANNTPGTNILGVKNSSDSFGSVRTDVSSPAGRKVPKREVSSASLWGEETVRSYDSGVGGLEDVGQARERGFLTERNDQTPDLLDCLILEDIEERVTQIRNGTAKPSELICLNNLMMLLNIQQLSSLEAETTSDMTRRPVIEDPAPGRGRRAILGSGSRRRDDEGQENYYQDMQRLASLMEQEVPLAFPGQTTSSPPVNIKHSPAQHPPAVNIAQGQFYSNNILGDLQFSSSRVNQALDQGFRVKPQSVVQRPQHHHHSTRKAEDALTPLQERVDEARFQLNALIRERRRLEESFNITVETKSFEAKEQGVKGPSRRSRQDLLSLLKDLGTEKTNLEKLLKKTSRRVPYRKRVMVDSLLDVINSWSGSAAQLLSLVKNSGSVGSSCYLDQGVMQINKETRRIRTMMWTIHNHNATFHD